MKNICVSFFFMLATSLNCQIITQAFNEPTVGDVDKNYKLDTSAYTGGLPTSVTGSNVVWDYTQVKGAFPVIFDSIIVPSAAPGASAWPGATYVQHRDVIYSFFKSVSSPARTEWLGSWSPSLSITFTNSALVASYPISYGYSQTDGVSGTFKYGNTSGACNGTISIVANGIGTLKFPNNVSFQNVLLLRSVEQLTASVGLFPVGTINQSIYSYYAPGKKYPVLSIQYQKYQLLAGSPTITALAYGNFDYFTVPGVHAQSGNEPPVIFPNPFGDWLTVSSIDYADANVYYFYDIRGQLVHYCNSTKSGLGFLEAGFYILEIRRGEHSVYQKVLKE